MTTSWKPLVLIPTEHPRAPDFTGRASPSQKDSNTAFSDPLPVSIPRKYLASSNFGHTYAVYTLVPLSRSNKDVLIQTIRRNHNYDSWRSDISLASENDFSNGTLRQIYDHHLRFIDHSPHANVAPTKFIVIVHSDWASNGVLIVNLHCQANQMEGVTGIVRTGVYTLTSSLMLLEASAHYWDDLKRHEMHMNWPIPITGYTGSHHAGSKT